ncbi:RNA-binding domain-containing protein [Martensiomyces pterosporus]|nr:RNA-binding domain-containing protein [Martensiomyces pterosporus]
MSASPETTKTATVDQFPHKVFVGNLSFKTTDGQLHDFFAEVGEVKEARIITRGPRSLGYGFVAFADDATVQKAVELKNHKDLAGREINVEAARPMPEGALEARANKSPRRRSAPRRAANSAEAPADAASADAAAEGDAEGEAQAKDGKAREGGRGRPRRQRRFPKKAKDEKADDEAKQDDRTPSETVVFVGNLPFSTEDEELTKLFADFSISSAHVVVSKKTGKPKGFGFVTFASNDDQNKALAKFAAEPIVVNDRTLTIKAALSETPAVTDSAPEAESA